MLGLVTLGVVVVLALTVLGELELVVQELRLVTGGLRALMSTLALMTPVETGLCVRVGELIVVLALTTLPLD